jgi:BNR repeat protein
VAVYPRAKSALRAMAAATFASAALASGPASAAPIQLSSDPYTSSATGQHRTEVEPDSFASGQTIVTAFQVARFQEGGGANVGWATSTDAGKSWTHGVMSGITTVAGGPNARATDAAVAYDPKHGVWLVASVGLGPPPAVRGNAVVVNRSATGTSWGSAVTVAAAIGSSDFDKSWIACDGTPTSDHYGNCYAQWDDFGDSGRLKMATSTDGGKTWGAPKNTADDATGLGGQPVVQPNGIVVVPYMTSFANGIRVFRSTDGGDSWGASTLVANVPHHTVSGDIRAAPLPSVETDADGRVYAAWEDCSFRPACKANDIVITNSADGILWAPVTRIPLAKVASDEEDFVPGLAVAPATSGSSTRLAVAYHYIPVNTCDGDSCNVHVGIVESQNAGATWGTPVDLTGAMKPSWLASTTEGYMTGDYISTSFAGGSPHPVFALARCPSGGRLHEAIYASNPPFGKGGPNCAPPPPPPRALTNLKIEPFRFPATRSGPSIKSSGKGTVSYRSSRAGRTRFNVGRAIKRNGKRAWVRVAGKFYRQDASGQNQFHFSGHIGGEKLKPGLYRLVVQPRDLGRTPGKVSYAQFRIVKSGAASR